MYCPGRTEYEADFIYFDLKTQYLTEVEIKTDIHDFRRDFKKKRYHDCKNVKYLYYAMPSCVYDEYREEINNMLSPTGLMYYLRIGCMKWVNR